MNAIESIDTDLRRGAVAAILLAAGASRRTAPDHKLLTPNAAGIPMAAMSLAAVEGSAAAPIIVVLGHLEAHMRAALHPHRATIVRSEAHQDGLAASLRAGLAAVPDGVSGVAVCLADMPFVTSACIDHLIAAHLATPDEVIAATYGGRRGNPVLWPRRFLPTLMTIEGDIGGRALLDQPGTALRLVPCGPGVLEDFDTQASLDAFRRR